MKKVVISLIAVLSIALITGIVLLNQSDKQPADDSEPASADVVNEETEESAEPEVSSEEANETSEETSEETAGEDADEENNNFEGLEVVEEINLEIDDEDMAEIGG